MVSQLSICFLKPFWHGHHGLRVVLFHSGTDHVSVHNAGYFWPCTGSGENRDSLVWSVLVFGRAVRITPPSKRCIRFRVDGQQDQTINFWRSITFLAAFSSVSYKYKPRLCFLSCHMDRLTQQANILIRIRSLFLYPFTWSPYLEPGQQFQNILTRSLSTMSVKVSEGDLGVENQNIKNPIIIAEAKLPRSFFSHFWGLGRDSGGKWFSQALSGRKRRRWMGQTCLQVCCLPWPKFDRRHLS